MRQLENVISDRGSKYAVSGTDAKDKPAVEAALQTLTRKKKYARATHNTWAVIFSGGTPLKSDDGESGAGSIILTMLQREQLYDHLIIVTRWYGGVHLGSDRFRHVKDCVKAYLD